MPPETVIAEAYLRAVIRVYAPWCDPPLCPAEVVLARRRVAMARTELARLHARFSRSGRFTRVRQVNLAG